MDTLQVITKINTINNEDELLNFAKELFEDLDLADSILEALGKRTVELYNVTPKAAIEKKYRESNKKLDRYLKTGNKSGIVRQSKINRKLKKDLALLN